MSEQEDQRGEADVLQNGGVNGGSATLQWTVGAIGAIITFGMIGFIGVQALNQEKARPPAPELRIERISPAGGGYLVEFVVRNRSPKTAARVEVEGELSRPGAEPETSRTTFDYLPGGSEVRGGLFYTGNPAAGSLELRPVGFANP